MASSIKRPSSSAESACGRYVFRRSISVFSLSASSARPPFSKLSTESCRCLTCLRITAVASASSSTPAWPPFSIAAFLIADLSRRRTESLSAARAFIASLRSWSICSEMLMLSTVNSRPLTANGQRARFPANGLSSREHPPRNVLAHMTSSFRFRWFVPCLVAYLLLHCWIVSGRKALWMDELISFTLVTDPSLPHALSALGHRRGRRLSLVLRRRLRRWRTCWVRASLPSGWSAACSPPRRSRGSSRVLRRTYGGLPAMFAVVLSVGGSTLILYQNSELRFYADLLFSTVAAVCGFDALFRCARAGRPPWRAMALNALGHALLVLVHPFGIAYSAAISLAAFATLFWRRPKNFLGPYLASTAVGCAFFRVVGPGFPPASPHPGGARHTPRAERAGFFPNLRPARPLVLLRRPHQGLGRQPPAADQATPAGPGRPRRAGVGAGGHGRDLRARAGGTAGGGLRRRTGRHAPGRPPIDPRHESSSFCRRGSGSRRTWASRCSSTVISSRACRASPCFTPALSPGSDAGPRRGELGQPPVDARSAVPRRRCSGRSTWRGRSRRPLPRGGRPRRRARADRPGSARRARDPLPDQFLLAGQPLRARQALLVHPRPRRGLQPRATTLSRCPNSRFPPS